MVKTDKSKIQTPEQKRTEMQEKLTVLGNDLIKEINAGDNLHLDIPIRGSANVLFDEKEKKILLGDKMAKRYLFNVAHARRFMQTMLVASYVKKDLLGNNLTATLRDLYYAKKRTIKGFKEETIEEQKESDLAIVDLEVTMDSFRERLHLRAEPKGRMAGDMVVLDRVRDKVDSIDLSRMGSGGWAVPSIVEQIEFKDVGIEFVLVAEKNAIFDRLNEDGYWAKNKCLLMTTAGQAARGARRLLQRISSELKVPCYCLSVDAGEPITIIDEMGLITRPRIGEFVNTAMNIYGITNLGTHEKSLAFGRSIQVNSEGKANTGIIKNAVRHKIKEPLLEVQSQAGYSVRVTRSHSLQVFDSEEFEIVSRKPEEIKKTDYLVSVLSVPKNEQLTKINLVEKINEIPELSKQIKAAYENGEFKQLQTFEGTPDRIKFGESELSFKPELDISPSLGRLLGYYVAEGHIENGVKLTFGSHEENTYAQDAVNLVKDVFDVKATLQKGKSSIRVQFGGAFVGEVLDKLFQCGKGAENKQIPWAIYNAPREVKIEFLRGYFRGDGTLAFSEKGCRLSGTTVSRKLAGDLVYLIKQIGGFAVVQQLKSKDEKEKERYNVNVYDKGTLRLLEPIVLDLAKGKREAVWNYLQKPITKLPIYKTIPAQVLKQVQKAIYKTTKKGIAHFVGNYNRVAFEKISPLLSAEPTSILMCDKILDKVTKSPASTRQIGQKTNCKFITAFKALKKLERKGIVKSEKIKGDLVWTKTAEVLALTTEEIRKLIVLKNLVENKVCLLQVKRIKEVQPTDEMVYDVEIAPTHSFVAGVGDLLLHNTDSDPYGWYIYSTMKYGSMALAHESERLGCPELKFLGMSTSDIEHYDLRNVTIKAKEVDIKRAEEMKAYAWFKSKEWQNEIDLFLDKKLKAEIQALSSKSLQYISNTYLPEKIKNQDFLP
ncbi:MAG: LAGLIDADG family homing endonuclease [Candidatus Micrarchaeota archaeon]